jgi:AcrR family transcriptional regulator
MTGSHPATSSCHKRILLSTSARPPWQAGTESARAGLRRWHDWPVAREHDTPAGGSQRRRVRSDALANQERVLAAAVTAVLREGRQVPMSTIAADAGVGIGTLYRRYPNREALLEALTLRAFRLVLECAENAENLNQPGLGTLSSFLDRVISHADQLVLPLHGGPIPTAAETLAARSSVHQALQRILDRGRRDGTIRADVTTRDIIVLTAMLAQQLPNNRGSDQAQAPRRLKAFFLDGLAPPAR